MSYGLGIDLGTSFTTGAISRACAGGSELEIVSLGSSTSAVASVLYLAEDGSVLVGEAAARRVLTEPERVYRGFARSLDDDALTGTAGAPPRPEVLAASMVQWVADKVAEREGEAAERIAVASPVGWNAFMRERLGHELIECGLEDLIFVSQPAAAAAGCDTMERLELGSAFAVYDLGGGSFKAVVLRKTGEDEFTTLGAPHVTEPLGGEDFDEAVLSHVLAELGDQAETANLHDPAVLTAMAQLLAECVRAKENLSTSFEVVIPIPLSGVQPQVRLDRSQFEAIIRPALLETIHGLRTALSSARVRAADLSAVLLVGGCSRIPLVAELISAALRRPIVVPPYPQMAVARGAALLAAAGQVHGTSNPLLLPVGSAPPEAAPRARHQAGKVLAAAITAVALGAVPLAIAQLDGASTPAGSTVREASPDAQGERIHFRQGFALPQQAGISNDQATQDRNKQPPATPAMTKPAEVKPAEVKPAEVKPAEVKPAEAKPAEAKPAEAKPAEAKPAEAKPAQVMPAEVKPAEVKPAEAKPTRSSSSRPSSSRPRSIHRGNPWSDGGPNRKPDGGFGGGPGDRPDGGFGGDPGDRPDGGFGGDPGDRPDGGSGGDPGDTPDGGPGERPDGGFGDGPGERPDGGFGDGPGERPDDGPGRSPGDTPDPS